MRYSVSYIDEYKNKFLSFVTQDELDYIKEWFDVLAIEVLNNEK